MTDETNVSHETEKVAPEDQVANDASASTGSEQPQRPPTQKDIDNYNKQLKLQQKRQLDHNRGINETLGVEVNYFTLQADLLEQKNRAMTFFIENEKLLPAYLKAVEEQKAREDKQSGPYAREVSPIITL